MDYDLRAKQSQLVGSDRAKGAVRGTHPTNRDQSCETNPICRSQICETKPIPTTTSGGAKAWWEMTYGESRTLWASAKQSQFRRVGRTQRNFQRSRRWGTMRQTNPICARGAGRMWYKQSRFGEARPRSGSRLCKTNPISGDAGWDQAPTTWHEGQMRQTNPICRRRRRSAVGQRAGDRQKWE
jgi:hypothetical protein